MSYWTQLARQKYIRRERGQEKFVILLSYEIITGLPTLPGCCPHVERDNHIHTLWLLIAQPFTKGVTPQTILLLREGGSIRVVQSYGSKGSPNIFVGAIGIDAHIIRNVLNRNMWDGLSILTYLWRNQLFVSFVQLFFSSHYTGGNITLSLHFKSRAHLTNMLMHCFGLVITIHIARFWQIEIGLLLTICIAPWRPRVLKSPTYIAAQLCNISNEKYRIAYRIVQSVEQTISQSRIGV